MALTEDQIQAIEIMIADALREDVQMATIASITSPVDAIATFDGSAANFPVKLFGNVGFLEGDRIGVVRWGRRWIGFGTFSTRWPGYGGAQNFQSTPGNTTSSTFSDLPTSLSFTFVKKYNLTRVDMAIAAAVWVGGTGDNGSQWGLKFDSPNYGTKTLDVTAFMHNAAMIGVHVQVAGFKSAPGGTDWATTLPASTYTVTVQWAKYTGPGQLNLNSDDRVSARCIEVEP